MGSVANTMGQMSNDVAELNNHQEHVVLRLMVEQPIHINDDSRDRQSIRKAIASCIDLFDVGKHQTERRSTASWAGHGSSRCCEQGATDRFAGQASVQTDRTEWKTLGGNRA